MHWNYCWTGGSRPNSNAGRSDGGLQPLAISRGTHTRFKACFPLQRGQRPPQWHFEHGRRGSVSRATTEVLKEPTPLQTWQRPEPPHSGHAPRAMMISLDTLKRCRQEVWRQILQ
jgi:hypothetical protein